MARSVDESNAVLGLLKKLASGFSRLEHPASNFLAELLTVEVFVALRDYKSDERFRHMGVQLRVIEVFDGLLASGEPLGRGTYATTTDTNRGREETRSCWVVPIPDDFTESVRWKGVAKIVRFESERTIDGKVTRGVRLFITSRKSLTAKQALDSVRGHWEIENKLHWTLDVAFREDDYRLRADNAAENFAVVRHLALNLLRGVKGSKVGIKNRRLEASRNDTFLMNVLSSHAN